MSQLSLLLQQWFLNYMLTITILHLVYIYVKLSGDDNLDYTPEKSDLSYSSPVSGFDYHTAELDSNEAARSCKSIRSTWIMNAVLWTRVRSTSIHTYWRMLVIWRAARLVVVGAHQVSDCKWHTQVFTRINTWQRQWIDKTRNNKNSVPVEISLQK